MVLRTHCTAGCLYLITLRSKKMYCGYEILKFQRFLGSNILKRNGVIGSNLATLLTQAGGVKGKQHKSVQLDM